MKKFGLMLLMLLLLLSGCTGGQEIESGLFVIAMAVDAAPEGNLTVTVKAHNEYLSAEIHLEKEKEILKPYTDADGYIRQALTTTYGLGFVFGLYNADDIHYADSMLPADTLIAVGMTDMHGNLTFSGNLPHGA